ncbi:Uncharacterised protein [Acinetobacter baumannii]|nr:Uncharacterised protein [Acinetobacter baumannii]SSS35068.1 Uncharacterised protein [Acinetobacter baumannii]
MADLNALRILSSGIQSFGNQPQPGLNALGSASKDWREIHNGSIERSNLGPNSLKAKGASGATT